MPHLQDGRIQLELALRDALDGLVHGCARHQAVHCHRLQLAKPAGRTGGSTLGHMLGSPRMQLQSSALVKTRDGHALCQLFLPCVHATPDGAPPFAISSAAVLNAEQSLVERQNTLSTPAMTELDVHALPLVRPAQRHASRDAHMLL